MDHSFLKKAQRHLIPSLLLIFGLTLASQSVVAQAPGSSRGLTTGEGSNMITGRVLFPPGQAGEGKSLRVSLENVGTFSNLSATTDLDGTFRFRGLAPGDYTVVVDGAKEYETARESVNIGREGSGRTIQVTIQLRPKVDASNPAFAGVPSAALSSYQKGVEAAKKGNSKSAVEFLSSAVTAYPGFAIALNELGMQYMLLKDMSKAAETFEALLKLKPNDAHAHLNLGIALFNQKKFEEAEVHLREALKLNNSGPTAHYYLGLTLVSVKRYGESEKEFELAISNGGENLALAHKYLGGLYWSAKKNQQAADEFEKYLKLDPKAPDAERIKGTIKDLRKQ